MAVGKDASLSSERQALKAEFLAANGLGEARRQPLTGDASTRAYERLFPADGGASLIFMDQPPALETQPCPPDASPAERVRIGYNASYRLAAGRVDAFVACAGFLRANGLSAPQIHAADPAAGLAILEDLGDDLFAGLIEAGADEAPFYERAIDALAALHRAPAPALLRAQGSSWPLLTYDDLALKTGADVMLEWAPKADPTLCFDAEALAAWEAALGPIRAGLEARADVFCHRDYHAENLIWLPERPGVAAVGMLDFQDALLAHRAWDLMMLLQDARRDVAPEREAACLDRYLAAESQLDRAAFLADYAAVCTLNACRLIGLFHRLTIRDHKPRYASFIPRVWAYQARNLVQPGMEPARAWFDRYVPQDARR
jgi:aminoglycoside/choline kinase family phosphotransferase